MRSYRRTGSRERGFTLVEAAIATAIVAMVIAAVGYGMGTSGATVRSERRSFHRAVLIGSKMNELDATAFGQLAPGADTVSVDGATFNRGWSVTRYDGNADSTPDAGLMLVTVWVDTDTCQTLRCDLR